MKTDWNARWLDMAFHIASWSKDPSTKVGCVLVRDQRVIATGYNGFPRGHHDDPALLDDRVSKLRLTVHAEANAVAHAAFHGVSLKGATAYTTMPSCCQCATLLIQAGVSFIYAPEKVLVPQRWFDDFEIAARIFASHGIPYRYNPLVEFSEPALPAMDIRPMTEATAQRGIAVLKRSCDLCAVGDPPVDGTHYVTVDGQRHQVRCGHRDGRELAQMVVLARSRPGQVVSDDPHVADSDVACKWCVRATREPLRVSARGRGRGAHNGYWHTIHQNYTFDFGGADVEQRLAGDHVRCTA